MFEPVVCAPLVPAPSSHQLLTVFLHIIYFLFLMVILTFNLVVYRLAKKYATQIPRIPTTPEPRITAPLSVAQILLPHEATWQRSSRYVDV
uniref:Uncharacterized protein n=1 Tax=Meloidogyne enterolobii TaxID=390850 RepID=A0A6V7URA8_MELEN|nr:unnamed protein product [Meloidogyne enterolobii]